MTGTNHALTGGVIGLAIGGSLAIPIAFASHFVLDALPHFGASTGDRVKNRKYFLRANAIDGTLLLIVFTVAMVQSLPWYVYASMIAAMSPDFVWVYRYIFDEKFGKLDPKPKNSFSRFHANIQTSETISGIWIELFWFALMAILALNLI